MQLPLYKIFLCTIINPLNDKECHYFKKGALVIKRGTRGYKVVDIGNEKDILPLYRNKRSIEVVEMAGRVLMPTFFDMHFHWVQDDVCLMPKEDLLDWLSDFTWPNESKFKDRKFANQKVKQFAQKLVSVGTLGGGCFASIHGHSVDLALNNFIGDYVVGNVLMTMNSPDYMTQTDKAAIDLVAKKSKQFKNRYAVTPRFAITTGPEVMKAAAALAKKNRSFIQSHLSETHSEIEFVLEIYRKLKGFEKVPSYTEIYNRCNTLGSKTIMGHGIYLGTKELSTLKKTDTAIAHCPTSNAPVEELGLGSGLFNFKKVERAGIRWALGSDIGGGPFLSMLDVMRSFVEQNSGKNGATYSKALYRATLAGAEILGLSDRVGNLSAGKEANFLVMDAPEGNFRSGSKLLEALISGVGRSNYATLVKNTYFRGDELYRFK